jgi:hypothetical protein
MVANTHDGHVDGNAKMPMALQTQCNESQDLREDAWRMVYDSKTSRDSRPYDTLGFGKRKGKNG